MTRQPTAMESADVLYRTVLNHVQARDWPAADSLCRRLTTQHPAFAAGWLAASKISAALGSAPAALDAIDRALAIEPTNARLLLHRAQCLLALGRREEALLAASAAEDTSPRDPVTWDAIGTLRAFANDQQRALIAYDRAVALAPRDPQIAYNRASVRRFLGDLRGAEADYDRAIAGSPSDYEAYLNRTELRVQTVAHNHIAELEALASQPIADWRGEVQIRYALAKECEDVGQYEKSFEHLRRGAQRRREHMRYDVATDLATVEWIISAFPAAPEDNRRSTCDESPIFIVGLPRSGTTLVERILSSHSSIAFGTELDCFALALVDAARRRSGRERLPRQELVALSATLDFEALGQDYLQRARATFGSPRPFHR